MHIGSTAYTRGNKMATRRIKHGKDGPVKRSTYPRLDGITPKSLEYFGTKRNIVVFLNEIVKRGGEMRAAEALEYEWWDVAELLEADTALQNLVDRQKLS
jgi:hypothetical protein